MKKSMGCYASSMSIISRLLTIGFLAVFPATVFAADPFLDISFSQIPRSISAHPTPQTIGRIRFKTQARVDVRRFPMTIEFQGASTPVVELVQIRNPVTGRTMELIQEKNGKWIAMDFLAENGAEWVVRMNAGNIAKNTSVRMYVDAFPVAASSCPRDSVEPQCTVGVWAQDLESGDNIPVRPGTTIVGRWTRMRGGRVPVQ